MQHLDSLIIAGYFLAIVIAGYLVSRRQRGRSANEFITGGRTQTWYETGLALLGMAVDPGYMSIAGLGFAFGLYLTQWTGVHVWFTTWFAAMFLVPIYWRSRIVTTPEYLERRFNVQCRVVFSLLMVVVLVATLGLGLYLGALLLEGIVGWSFTRSVIFIAMVTGSYVILGGMRTVLALDTWQAIFLFVTLLVVGGMAVYSVGGIGTLAAMQTFGDGETRLPSIVPPSTWDPKTTEFFPAQAIVLWATVVGLSWLGCNFGMVQRVLAARSERDAQKGLLLLGALAAIVPTCSFLVGVAVRHSNPDMKPDLAFLHVMMTQFPAGVRGLLAAGMMAALLSTADGLLTGSSALLSEDVYLRFMRPRAGERERKLFARLAQGAVLLIGVLLVPVLMKSRTAMQLVQSSVYADVFGVIVGLYLVGMFSRRATGRAAFIASVTGVGVAIALDLWTDLNFAYVGFCSFVYTFGATLLLSLLEPRMALERLTNLTIHTLPDAKGPWVGLASWPHLGRWAALTAGGWFVCSAAWEWYVRTR